MFKLVQGNGLYIISWCTVLETGGEGEVEANGMAATSAVKAVGE